MIDLKNTYIDAGESGVFDSELANAYIEAANSQGYKTSSTVKEYLGVHPIIGIADWPMSPWHIGQSDYDSKYIFGMKKITMSDLLIETPEEKESLDRLSTEDFIVVGNPEKFSEFKEKWEGFDTAPAQFESLAVEVNSEPVWNGEGLPPVGVECEKWFSGDMVVIVPMSYVDDVLFYKNKSTESYENLYDWCYHGNCDFKLIETPEQKSAREREEEIEKMTDIAFEGEGTDLYEIRWACTVLYDAGYRKPEQGDS